MGKQDVGLLLSDVDPDHLTPEYLRVISKLALDELLSRGIE